MRFFTKFIYCLFCISFVLYVQAQNTKQSPSAKDALIFKQTVAIARLNDAIRSYSGDIAFIKKLLKAVDNPNDLEELMDTPLIVASEKEHIDIVKVLLQDSRVDPNVQNKAGNTALIWAGRKNNVPIITLLLKHPKTDPTITNCAGEGVLDVVKSPLKKLIKEYIKQWTLRQKSKDKIKLHRRKIRCP